jgi:hypothetical protein
MPEAFRFFFTSASGLHSGQIVLRIVAEGKHSVLGEMEVYVAAQMHCAGEPFAHGNHDAPAACLMACDDGLADGHGIVDFSTRLRPEVSNDKISRRKNRHANCRHAEERFDTDFLVAYFGGIDSGFVREQPACGQKRGTCEREQGVF